MAQWLKQASQQHEMRCHDLEDMSSDPSCPKSYLNQNTISTKLHLYLFCLICSIAMLTWSVLYSLWFVRKVVFKWRQCAPWKLPSWWWMFMKLLTLKVLNFWTFTWTRSGWIFDSYSSLKPLCSGMGEVVPARTSPTLPPPSPRTVL